MSSVLIEQPNYVLRVSGREFSLITRALMGSLQEMAIKESDSTREKKRKRERVKRINERMQNEPRSAYEAKETRKKEVELEDGRKVRKYINDADAAMKLGEKLLSQSLIQNSPVIDAVMSSGLLSPGMQDWIDNNPDLVMQLLPKFQAVLGQMNQNSPNSSNQPHPFGRFDE